MPPPEPVQGVGRVRELRALGFAVDMRDEAGPRVIDGQVIAASAELEVEVSRATESEAAGRGQEAHRDEPVADILGTGGERHGEEGDRQRQPVQ